VALCVQVRRGPKIVARTGLDPIDGRSDITGLARRP
jgi:hypothetical protein